MGVRSKSADDSATFWLGFASAVLSGILTYLYVLSVYAYPLFIVLFILTRRRYRRLGSPGGAPVFGVALSVAALLMPVLCIGSWLAFVALERRIRPNGPFVTGEPFFFAIFTPPVAALVGCILTAWIIARRRREAGRNA